MLVEKEKFPVDVWKYSVSEFVQWWWQTLPSCWSSHTETNVFQTSDACARAESVTENRNRYRDILKNQHRHRRRYWKNPKNENQRKKYRKKRKFGFCWWRFTNLKYIHFLPLTLRNEDVKLHYPRVLSLLLCTVLENCRNSSSTSKNNTGGPSLIMTLGTPCWWNGKA